MIIAYGGMTAICTMYIAKYNVRILLEVVEVVFYRAVYKAYRIIEFKQVAALSLRENHSERVL